MKGETKMRFPNAHKGVKKLFIAEIVGIVASLLILVSGILFAIGVKNTAVLASSAGVALAGSIALVVVFIISLVGLYQGGQDNDSIKAAFYLTIAALLLNILAAIFSAITQVEALVIAAKYIGIAVDVATVIALEYTLLGISGLAKQLGNEKMASLGRTLAWFVLGLYALSILLGLFGNIFSTNAQDWVKTAVAVTTIVAGVLELIVYVAVVVYYGKATKMLKQ